MSENSNHYSFLGTQVVNFSHAHQPIRYGTEYQEIVDQWYDCRRDDEGREISCRKAPSCLLNSLGVQYENTKLGVEHTCACNHQPGEEKETAYYATVSIHRADPPEEEQRRRRDRDCDAPLLGCH